MEIFKVRETEAKDGPLSAIGSGAGGNDWPLQIPSIFQRLVVYPHLEISVTLDCVFSGERIEVAALKVVADKGHFVSSRDLTQLSLPAVIRAIGLAVIPVSERWLKEFRDESDKTWESQKASDEFLSQLYWFEHVIWGTPRMALQEYMGWTRTTANAKIREINKQFPLPGVHSSASKKLLPAK